MNIKYFFSHLIKERFAAEGGFEPHFNLTYLS